MQATPTFAGIDWSWKHHAVCIVDDGGQRIEEATVPHSRPGLAKVTAVLRRHGVERVGIERGDGPVVEHLIRDGFEVVVISARQVKSLRARYGSAGNKDDRFDAFVLADALRTDAGRWAVVQPDSQETMALRMLVRARHDLIDHRIAVHNQLLAVLQHNFPGAIGLFSQLDIPISLAFLRRFPTEAKAAWLSELRMAHWLQANHYCGRHTATQLVGHLRDATAGRLTGAAADASQVIVLDPGRPAGHPAPGAGPSRGPDQGSPASSSRRSNLPVTAPRRDRARRDPVGRDRRLPRPLPRRTIPGSRSRSSPLDPAIRQAPQRHLPTGLQHTTAGSPRRLGPRHPTRQRLGPRHLRPSTRPRLSPPPRSTNPVPRLDQDPVALLARPCAL